MTSPLLERAQGGDERAFQELTAPHVRELHLHCYRMLGSVTDADDLLQEILLAAWTGLDGFAGRSSLRTWLYRIATNRCLNAIRDGKRRPPTEPLPPFDPPEPTRRGDITWLQPYPDTWLEDHAVRRETIELAFVTALQRVPPRQTATLVLVDVLGFTIAEVADQMDTTPTAAKGALQRARAAMKQPRSRRAADREGERAGRAPVDGAGERAGGVPGDGAGQWVVGVPVAGERASGVPGDGAGARVGGVPGDGAGERAGDVPVYGARERAGNVPVDSEREWAVARRFAAAFVADDIEAVTSLLTDDAWLAMPPAPHEYQGAVAIAAFLRASANADGRRDAQLRLDASGCNHQPGLICYFLVEGRDPWYAGRFVLTIDGERISRITRFLEPALEKVLT
ncbi:sigma-70 family RNA polymerase sigma factor [Kribbella italica]|uniref:RNA polymerase sigma factor (Sigma-70 family) n=1 Tax=Kribbella italica TaxID=1540520 RepID=A0A7W9MSM0_9ACTN|nr:sigma-70 family RNA polymerase sigma factor [Kribbella italica]MBB5834225.1 RNA polymerase sigma factor (sigma-70 family) [Kribbella italica]